MSYLIDNIDIILMVEKAYAEWERLGCEGLELWKNPDKTNPDFMILRGGHNFALDYIFIDESSKHKSVNFVCSECGFWDNSYPFSAPAFRTLKQDPVTCADYMVRKILEA